MNRQQALNRKSITALVIRGTAAAAFGASLVIAGCNSTPAPIPLSQLNPAQAHGHEVFQERCSVCHYDRSADPLHGPGLRGVFKKQYLPSGAPANDDRVTAIIRNGRGMMPPQPGMADEDLDSLLAYLHTL